MKRPLLIILALSVLLGGFSLSGRAYGAGTPNPPPECKPPDTLSMEAAQGIINGINPSVKVLDIKLSPICGLWDIGIEFNNQKGNIYLDFARQNLIQGNIIRLRTDVSRIPTKDAILIGKQDAPYKVIVFDDPM